MSKTLCISCTTEENEVSFPTVKEYVEHEKSGHKIMPKIKETEAITPTKSVDNPPSVPEQPKKEPIILKYKYEGTHDCGHTLDTIQISVGEKAMCVAYCSSCKIQVTSQLVIPLDKQTPEFTKGKYIIEKKK